MRLMTLNKIYRAFPELDEFSDADCQAWVAAARRQIRWLLLSSTLLVGLLGAMTAIYLLTWIPFWRWLQFPLLLEAVMLIGLPILCGSVPAYIARDVLIRKKIRRQVLRAQCADCGFSLLGLPTFEGHDGERVRCPECGVVRSLKGMQLTKEELLSGVRPPGSDAVLPESALPELGREDSETDIKQGE